MAPAKETVSGHEAIGAFFRANFAAVQFDRDLHVHDVTWDGDLGAVQCSTTGTVTVRATGATKNVDSREIFLLRRGEDSWRIQCYMFNPPNEASVH
jgi:ketosteroid isomerase-like protein